MARYNNLYESAIDSRNAIAFYSIVGKNLWRSRSRFTCHVASTDQNAWFGRVGHLSNSLTIDIELPCMLTCSRGCPRIRWDDVLTAFTCDVFLYVANHWIDGIVTSIHDVQIEYVFLLFV